MLVPFAKLALLGVTAIDTRVAEVTVSGVEPETLPSMAVIVLEPVAVPVATPFVPAALLMAAVPGADELHVTAVVRFCVEPSLKVPVAMYCWVVPLAMLTLAGVTEMDCKVAAVTVSCFDAETPPNDAEIVVEPALSPSATPCEPDALLTVATAGIDELQMTDPVRSWVVPSL